MYRRLFLLTVFCLLALATNLASCFFFGWIDGLIAGGTTHAVVGRLDFPTLLRVFFPLGAVAMAIPCLLIEVRGLGWQESSLRRLLLDDTSSTYTDLFYLALTASGIRPLLAFVMSLGTGYWINALIARHFSINLLTNAPFAVSFAVLVVVNTFVFYWAHRIMHTPLFWEVHKVHHSAEHLNIITPHRNHPIDMVVVTIVNALPAAALGASPTVILVYVAINAVYQQMAHSHWDWKLSRFGLGFIESHLIISSAAHRIHHSDLQKHWNKNFGVTPVWDRLFGTYYRHSPGEKVLVGLLAGGELTNTGRPIWEIWMIYRRWLKIASGLLGNALGVAAKKERATALARANDQRLSAADAAMMDAHLSLDETPLATGRPIGSASHSRPATQTESAPVSV